MSNPFPTAENFLSQLHDLHIGSSNYDDKPILPKALLDPVCELILAFYKQEFLTLSSGAEDQAKLADPRNTLTVFLTACYQAINAFRDVFPPEVFEPPQPALLHETVTLNLEHFHGVFAGTIGAHKWQLRAAGLTNRDNDYPPYYQDFDEPEPRFYDDEPLDTEDKLQWRNDRRYFQEHTLADWKETKRKYEKLQKQFASPRSPVEMSFLGTPFYRFWQMLPPEYSYQVPLSKKLTPALRIAHEFVLSPSRSGKTTFLIAQILEDLERVKRGECSVIAMDSENELIPELAKLAVFGPGGELEGKLIYLEPTKYPLALNIFDRGDTSELSEDDRDELYRAALSTTHFFINSIGKTDTSGHQDIVLKFIVQALMTLPAPTLADLRGLLQEKGYAAYKDKFVDLDPEVARTIEIDIHTDMKASTTAVRSRITGMISDPLFRKVFAEQKNKLDFFDLLQTPKVVLISTAGLADATGPFGCFIIAKLNEAVMKRKFVPKSSKLPIYCYIDEASHYVPEEPMFAKMIDRVAKQGLGLIIATQRDAHITNANVLDALKSVAIQVQTRKPNAIISIDQADPITVHVPLIDLTKMPQMTEEQQADIRLEMARRFGPEKAPLLAPPPKQISAEPGDETDAKPW